MGCGGCGKSKGVKYEVTWTNGRTPSTETYASIGEAQAAITASGASSGEATFKAVSA